VSRQREVPDDLPSGLTVRINPRARRISLRLNAKGEAVLVLPDESFRAEGLRFAAEKRHWLDRHRTRQPDRVPFAAGSTIPVRGEPHLVQNDPLARDPVSLDGTTVTVSGQPAMTERLLTGWLKREAARDFQSAVGYHAATLRLPEPPITLRDPKTRWGSCSSRKTLSLSWRLILAPPDVLDYVAAHEVCHLLEMNHSARFWALVKRICPSYREQEAWLKDHGRSLHRYG
jgi:predicted metal-dependent hydrolase